MNYHLPKELLRSAIFPLIMLLTSGGVDAAQTVIDVTSQSAPTVNLTAQPMNATLPDGNTVPMWGFCTNDPTVQGEIVTGSVCSTTWAPGPTIIVQAGSKLTISLTNSLPTPTSLVILGQLGGGLGTPNKVASPAHTGQASTTWPAVSPTGAASFTPPTQANRVRSFGTEVGATGKTALTWANLKPGTYLYETGTLPSIQAPMGLYGVLVVTTPPMGLAATFSPGAAYPGVAYDADVVLLFSEIDPVQNVAVAGACSPSCDEKTKFPPAVNYTPKYFLINGQAFDKTAPQKSAFLTSGNTGTTNILVRMVNAGSRTHIPAIVGQPMSLVGEDGNAAPGNPKVQNEVLLTAGKTYDVTVKPTQTTAGTYDVASYPVFDRSLSLSTNNTPDGGMQGLLMVAPTGTTTGSLINGGVGIGTNGNGVGIGTNGQPLISTAIAVAANPDTFMVPPNSPTFTGNVLSNDNGITSAAITSATLKNTVTVNPDGSITVTPLAVNTPIVADKFQYCGNGSTTLCTTVTLTLGSAPIANNDTYTSKASTLTVSQPGVLGNDIDPSNFPLNKLTAVIGTNTNTNTNPCVTTTLNPDGSFTATGTGTCTFSYTVSNAQGAMGTGSATVTLTFPTASGLIVSAKGMSATAPSDPNQDTPITDYAWVIEEDTTIKHNAGVTSGPDGKVIGNSFHASNMPLVAAGCTGPLSCFDAQTIGGQPAPKKTPLDPKNVNLDPAKTYYISILPGSAANSFIGTGSGYTMGGATITPGQTAVTVRAPANPMPTAQLNIYIYEDNSPTNGAPDGAEQNQGLGGFAIILNDVAASSGDPIGQMTYDAFNLPLTNALLGTEGCPGNQTNAAANSNAVGVVYTCPEPSAAEIAAANTPALQAALDAKYTLRGHALIQNLMAMRYDVIANPSAEREGHGERWIQTQTLEGTKAQDAFAKAGEPSYFQEFGPPGPHTTIGFVNPDKVNAVNAQQHGAYTVSGQITNRHMSRPINVTNYDSGSHAPLAHTTCYVGINAQAGDGDNIGFASCDQDGKFKLTGIPNGTHQLVVWDQWLDQIMDTVAVTVNGASVALGTVDEFSWFTHTETSTYLDLNTNGIRDSGEPGIAEVLTKIRFRDGRVSNKLLTDSNGVAAFNELFPLFNWYVTESDTTRYVGTGVNTVVDGGGKPDASGTYAGILNSTYPTGGTTVKQFAGTTKTLGLQGFISQTNMVDWGKRPYNVGENGGITGFVTYTSTRGFDDPGLEVQFNWEPGVPRVTVNLYKETTNPDGTTGLQFVTTTTSSSWDDWANAVDSNGKQVNMSCPGQLATDPYVAQTLGGDITRCYDGFHNWNQVQPAVYDGRYYFNGIPAGKYVVEVVPPVGYEIVKEEDKNILIGDAWAGTGAAPQFAGLSNIFILPDQATVNAVDGPPAGVQFPKCVGNLHRVPDYLSLFPNSGQVSPFAGQDRALCNRKEVNLEDQMQANADFHLFTPTPIASHYTGMILDDTSNEFNVVSPDFGEKFGVPFVPVSIKDFNGVEISRVYADEWGMFNGLTPSTWEVNVPNPAGYSPNMLITCMNDPGPIKDSSGKLITDPLYNPMFSNFCYTNPFMPGATDYLDTPVVPVAAFASGYNPPDCALPASTPAILRVDSSFGNGPYLPTASGILSPGTLTITALGDKQVPNPAYSGPGGTASKTINRHYGFGSSPCASTGPCGNVTIGNVPLTNVSWADGSITGTVPSTAKTGELVITTANEQKSVDTVTVTIEAATATSPARVSAGGSIQAAIDAANPGDLILVDPGTYNELVIMWKPVRLQGVGANSVIVNAAKYPTTKLDNWRPRINQLFAIDSKGNVAGTPQVDPLPGQEITGGVVLLEPSVLATEEGAGITVLAKNLPDVLDSVTNKLVHQCSSGGTSTVGSDITQSNFLCAPSRIDGLSVTGGDAGGGIYVNGWAHGLEIANNRVYGNAGALNGGVRIGQPFLEGQALPSPFDPNTFRGLGYNQNVNIHHNEISQNGILEDQDGAGGGLSICSGTDNYQVNYNFVCGNFTLADGGGIGHIGLSQNGTLSFNQILFNQSQNPEDVRAGGGLVIIGEPSTLGGLTVGTGNVTVDANLIQGNFSQAGHGGGIGLVSVNGDDVAANPADSSKWFKITLTNNMIANNVAGWSGGGISLADAVKVSIVNNTIAHNDSVAIVGSLIGATRSLPQPAGISSQLNSILAQLIPGGFSNPVLTNNILWQNRAFHFQGDLLTAGSAAALPFDGYWDLGIVGDASPTPGANKMSPTYSVISSGGYAGTNASSDPLLASAYFNDKRDTNALPGSMQVAIAADEGGNDVDLRYGPLALTGDYHIQIASPAIDKGLSIATIPSVTHDFDNQPRPRGDFDIGADESAVPGGVLSTTVLTFAAQQINTSSSPQSVTLTNNSQGPLTIGAITIGGANPLNFTQTSNCVSPLSIGASCSISATFTPNALGSRVAALNVALPGAATTPVTVTLSGTGIGPTGSVSTTSLSFSAQQIGTTSAAQSVILNNTGTGLLTIGNINIGGTNPTNFALTNNTCGTSLAAGLSCTMSVVFKPNGVTTTPPNSPTATLNVPLPGAVTTPLTVALSGSAVAASDTVLPVGPLSFTAQTLITSAFQTLTVSNNGSGPLTLNTANGVAITGTNSGQFGIVLAYTTCANGITLAPNATCTVAVAFSPTGAAGPRAANLNINSNAALLSVILNGSNVAPAATLTGTAAFANQQVGTTSAATTFTYTNTGIGPITVSNTGVTLTSGNAANYAITTNTCIVAGVGVTLSAGGTCQIGVTFTPSATGSRTTTLTVADATGGAPSAAIKLSGTGIQAVVGFSGSTALTTTTANRTVKNVLTTITNSGNEPLVISSIAIAVNSGQTNNPGSYSVANPGSLGTTACPIGGTGLAVGALCQVTVTYTPPASGALNTITGTLTVTDTGAATATQTRSYTGN